MIHPRMGASPVDVGARGAHRAPAITPNRSLPDGLGGLDGGDLHPQAILDGASDQAGAPALTPQRPGRKEGHVLPLLSIRSRGEEGAGWAGTGEVLAAPRVARLRFGEGRCAQDRGSGGPRARAARRPVARIGESHGSRLRGREGGLAVPPTARWRLSKATVSRQEVYPAAALGRWPRLGGLW